MPSEVLGPLYKNIRVNYEELYKINFEDSNINFVIPSKTIKEVWKPKYHNEKREKSYYYKNCFKGHLDRTSLGK